MEYVVATESFHGPLDLLLYLIEKNEIDIHQIPVSLVADQYLQYISHTGIMDLDNMSDFLLMASYLLWLKAQTLLPGDQDADTDLEIEEDDPGVELSGKLRLYRQFKHAARHLLSLQNGDYPRTFFKESMGMEYNNIIVLRGNAGTLAAVYGGIMKKDRARRLFNERGSQDIQLDQKIERLLRELGQHPRGIVFQNQFRDKFPSGEMNAYFLALLELIRIQLVEYNQDIIFGDIMIVFTGDERIC